MIFLHYQSDDASASDYPVVLSKTPLNYASGVPWSQAFTLTFSLPVIKGTGSIRLYANGVEVAEVLASALTLSGAVVSWQWGVTLDPSTFYSITADAGLVKATTGLIWEGAWDGGGDVWQFTTAAIPDGAPWSEFDPAPLTIDVDFGTGSFAVEATVSTPVWKTAGTAKAWFYEVGDDGYGHDTYTDLVDLTSAVPSESTDGAVGFTVSYPGWEMGTRYGIRFEEGFFSFSETEQVSCPPLPAGAWTFTSYAPDFYLVATYPANLQTDVADANPVIQVRLNSEITTLNYTNGPIALLEGTGVGTLVEELPENTAPLSGDSLVFQFDATLSPVTTYQVKIPMVLCQTGVKQWPFGADYKWQFVTAANETFAIDSWQQTGTVDYPVNTAIPTPWFKVVLTESLSWTWLVVQCRRIDTGLVTASRRTYTPGTGTEFPGSGGLMLYDFCDPNQVLGTTVEYELTLAIEETKYGTVAKTWRFFARRV